MTGVLVRAHRPETFSAVLFSSAASFAGLFSTVLLLFFGLLSTVELFRSVPPAEPLTFAVLSEAVQGAIDDPQIKATVKTESLFIIFIFLL